jgi:hypothetical protein
MKGFLIQLAFWVVTLILSSLCIWTEVNGTGKGGMHGVQVLEDSDSSGRRGHISNQAM